MKQSYQFTDEKQQTYTVEFEVMETEAPWRRFGIRGKMYGVNSVLEQAEAAERFLTEEEANATVNMLCKEQVTPCTLTAVLE